MPTRYDSSLITMLRRLDAVRLEQVGSGFLLQVGDHHFLISAAHVLIESTLELPTSPSLRLEHAGHILASSSFDSPDNPGDRYDVGCIHLTPDAVARLTAIGRTFLNLPDIARNFPPVAPIVCVFAGFPASFSKMQVGLKQVVSTPTYIRGEKLSDDQVRAVGHDPRFNFGMAYNREQVTTEETNQRVTGPVAIGMSGGPVWLILPDGRPLLVGIGTHYDPDKNTLIGSLVVPLIMEAMRRYAGEPIAVSVQSGPPLAAIPPEPASDGNRQG